jgi:hypothetical protein
MDDYAGHDAVGPMINILISWFSQNSEINHEGWRVREALVILAGCLAEVLKFDRGKIESLNINVILTHLVTALDDPVVNAQSPLAVSHQDSRRLTPPKKTGCCADRSIQGYRRLLFENNKVASQQKI